MKLALKIVGVLTLITLLLFYFTLENPGVQQYAMPWNVTVDDPMHPEVLGITLNQTTLDEARTLFGKLESIALYQNPHGEFSLEAFFGKISFGPFSARIIALLDAPQEVLADLTEHTVKRVQTRDQSNKWTLDAQRQKEQGLRRIRSLTYLPDYRGIDQAYVRQYFGEPESIEELDATTVIWLYPQKGIKIMIDEEGRDLFEYMAPAEFEMLSEKAIQDAGLMEQEE